MKKLNILVVFDSVGPPPKDQNFEKELKTDDWSSEASVIKALGQLGHNVTTLGVYDDIDPITHIVRENRPDVVFNLAENFHGQARFEKNIPALFELLEIPYTGCSAEGISIAKNKAISKKILRFHKIKVPDFQVFRRDSSRKMHKRMKFPLIVKPLNEEASIGIAQASFVDNTEQLNERINLIHNNLGMHAIAEEFIEGRELYVGVFGKRRLTVLPVREMKFHGMPEENPKIATYKAKWDKKYRKKWGIRNIFADNISDELNSKITKVCKKAYRALGVNGYTRFDVRLTQENGIFIIEANANPAIASDEDFAKSAEKAGIAYNNLIQKLVNIAFKE